MFVLYLVYSCLYISYIGITFYFVYSYSHCISYMILHYISYLPIHIILHFIYSCSYYISYIGIHIVSYIGIMLYYIFIYYIILYYIILYYIILFRVFNVYLGKYIKYIISVVLCYIRTPHSISRNSCIFAVFTGTHLRTASVFFQFHNFASLWQCSLLPNPSEPSVPPHCRRIVCM